MDDLNNKEYTSPPLLRYVLAFIASIPAFLLTIDIYKGSETSSIFFESLLYASPFFAGVGALIACILIRPKNKAERIILNIFGTIIFIVLLVVILFALAWSQANSGW
jgi:peptidoglycan/LPS O-acetylase OafA/YrhL